MGSGTHCGGCGDGRWRRVPGAMHQMRSQSFTIARTKWKKLLRPTFLMRHECDSPSPNGLVPLLPAEWNLSALQPICCLRITAAAMNLGSVVQIASQKKCQPRESSAIASDEVVWRRIPLG